MKPLKPQGYNPHAPASNGRAAQPLRKITPRGEAQTAYLEAMRSHDLVIATGPAGTGKTWLAAAAAAQSLIRGDVARIIMSRPALEAGERLGFLPGDISEKIDPYLRPLYDALSDVLGFDEMQRCIRAGLIEIAPLAFMRGRSLARAFIILDEAQNCTRAQMKMFLTRLGQGSCVVLAGDPSQSDLPAHEPSGLQEAIDLLAPLEDVAVIRFDERDIQRHNLVNKIVRAYKNKTNDDKTA